MAILLLSLLILVPFTQGNIIHHQFVVNFNTLNDVNINGNTSIKDGNLYVSPHSSELSFNVQIDGTKMGWFNTVGNATSITFSYHFSSIKSQIIYCQKHNINAHYYIFVSMVNVSNAITIQVRNMYDISKTSWDFFILLYVNHNGNIKTLDILNMGKSITSNSHNNMTYFDVDGKLTLYSDGDIYSNSTVSYYTESNPDYLMEKTVEGSLTIADSVSDSIISGINYYTMSGNVYPYNATTIIKSLNLCLTQYIPDSSGENGGNGVGNNGGVLSNSTNWLLIMSGFLIGSGMVVSSAWYVVKKGKNKY